MMVLVLFWLVGVGVGVGGLLDILWIVMLGFYFVV